MPTITIKNIPDDLYAQLKAAAKAHRRSINGELIACLEKALQPQRTPANEYLAEARALRQQYDLPILRDNEINEAKHAGRS